MFIDICFMLLSTVMQVISCRLIHAIYMFMQVLLYPLILVICYVMQVLTCYFIVMQVISCQLILDVANQLLERFLERDIELLLILMKGCFI